MTRSGQWEVFRRCLSIIVRLECGPATRQELIALAYPELPENSAQKRLEKDMERLRHSLDLQVTYDSTDRVYRLHSAEAIPLLDLPDKAMQGLAFLADTFRSDMPQFFNIQVLIDSLIALLSQDKRAALVRARSSLAVDLRQRDEDDLSDEVWHKLETAHLHWRMVQFRYRSPSQDDQEPRTHLVEARKLYFDTDRRHYYLWGYCHRVHGPQGEWAAKRYMRYRIGRIVEGSVEILPDRFPSAPPSTPMFQVSYRLSPTIARLGVSHHFEKARVEYSEDGYATIHAETDDIFHAVRTLLYYGANCEILGGPELIVEYRNIVSQMLRLNGSDRDSLTDMGEPT